MRPPTGVLTVDAGRNGGVAIYGWSRDSVAVVARIQAEAESDRDAEAMAGEVRIEAGGGTIRTSGPSRLGRRQSWGVNLDVYVPRRSDLRVDTENGPISVEEVEGRIDVDAVNGPVSLEGLAGTVRARATNGPLHVSLTGATWNGEGLDAETTNGPVHLEIPEGYSARLETGTINGPMEIGFPLTVTVVGRMSRRISTTLGSGGPLVRVVTTNGPLVLDRPE